MMDIINQYSKLLENKTGLNEIINEMKRQNEDAIQTGKSQKQQIKNLAKAISKSDRIILLGMGASHTINQIFAFELCRLGYDALAITSSDFLYSAYKNKEALFIFTSQSGESIETVKCLKFAKLNQSYCLTLNGDSTIAKATIPIIGEGGSEKAYAGTRSVKLTVVIMAFVLSELGSFPVDVIKDSILFTPKYDDSFEKALGWLWSGSMLVSTGRGIASPISSLFSLGCQELSCSPFLNYETGQFRHGPKEMIKQDSVIVIFRQSGQLGELAKSFEEIASQTGCHLISIDFSGLHPLKNATTIYSKKGDNIISAIAVMEIVQVLMICYSCGKNPMTGIPKHSSKVTSTE